MELQQTSGHHHASAEGSRPTAEQGATSPHRTTTRSAARCCAGSPVDRNTERCCEAGAEFSMVSESESGSIASLAEDAKDAVPNAPVAEPAVVVEAAGDDDDWENWE